MTLPTTQTTVPLQNGGGGAFLLVFWLVLLALVIVTIAGIWKTFEKAEKPGWGAIVPVYNTYLLLKVGGNSGWWLLALLVPILSFFVALKMMIDVARQFGQGIGFGLGLGFLGFIFFPLLGFGEYTYDAPEVETVDEDWV